MNHRIYALCEVLANEISGESDEALDPLGDAISTVLSRGVPGVTRGMWAGHWHSTDDDQPCPPEGNPLHSAQSRRAVVVTN